MEQRNRERKCEYLKERVLYRIKHYSNATYTHLGLEYLGLTTNDFCIVVEIIYEYMPDITYLCLSYSKLTSMPECITSLIQLQEIDLSNNALTNIPEFISELKQLKILILDNNNINFVEYKSLEGCESLEKLCIDNNCELTYIDPRIFDIPTLTFIGIYRTKISKEYLCILARHLITSPTTILIRVQCPDECRIKYL